MSQPADRRDKGLRKAFYYCFPALIVLTALLGAAHILLRTSTYGAALGNDAFNYISAAERLAAGEGMLNPGGGRNLRLSSP